MKKNTVFIKRVLAVCCAFFITSSVFAPNTVEAAKTLSELRAERDALAKKTEEAKKALENAKAQQLSVMEELDALDKVVAAASEELNRSKEDLEEVTTRLNESQAQLDEATAKREAEFEIFGERLRFFYENGDTGYLDVILESKSVSDMLARMQYVEDIMEYDHNLLESLKESERIIKVKRYFGRLFHNVLFRLEAKGYNDNE